MMSSNIIICICSTFLAATTAARRDQHCGHSIFRYPLAAYGAAPFRRIRRQQSHERDARDQHLFGRSVHNNRSLHTKHGVKGMRAFEWVASGRRYDCDIAHATSRDLYGATLHKRRRPRVKRRGGEKLRSAEIMAAVGAVLETQDDGDARFKLNRLGRETEIRQADRYSARRQ